MYHSRQNWSWTFSLTVRKLVSAMDTENGMMKKYRFASLPLKTELVMDFQFDSSEAGKCQLYREWNGELRRFA